MRLPKLFSKKSNSKKYLIVLLSDHAVRSSLVEVMASGVAVLSQSQTKTYTDREAFILVADETLQQLSDASENVDEVIFALESNWANEKGIIDEKKPLLKQLTTQLSLKAVGFVVIPEAVIQAYGQGQTMSSLLAIVAREKVSLYLVQQGIIQKAETVGRSDQSIGDLFEGVARFTQGIQTSTNLPSTIVLASFEIEHEELETMRQELVQADWESQKVFLQQPVIDIIPPTAIADMVAIKGGEAVARSQGMAIAGNTVDVAAAAPLTSNEFQKPTSFGIPISSETVPDPIDDEIEVEQQAVSATTQQEKRRKLIKVISGGVIGGLVMVLLIIFFYIRTSAEAQVTITPKTAAVTKELEITVDSTLSASDPEALILAGTSVSTTVEGQDSIATTGRKLVGDPAKGQVTIFNKTESEKSFVSGTTLTSGNLQYTLDADVTVPASIITQKQNGEERKYGEATVGITAKEIGEEGNIAKDTKLTIASFSTNTYDAVANDVFKGGASREVKVISDEDRRKILNDLSQELLKKGQEKLEAEAPDGQYILPSQSVTITASQYSGEIGVEANEVSVNATATVKAVSYSAEDLMPIAQKALESEIQSGYALTSEEPQILSAPIEGEDASSSAKKLTVNISAQTKPQFTEDSIENAIMGKKLVDAQYALTQNPQIQTVEITFVPAIAKSFGATIPKKPEKITVTFN